MIVLYSAGFGVGNHNAAPMGLVWVRVVGLGYHNAAPNGADLGLRISIVLSIVLPLTGLQMFHHFSGMGS